MHTKMYQDPRALHMRLETTILYIFGNNMPLPNAHEGLYRRRIEEKLHCVDNFH